MKQMMRMRGVTLLVSVKMQSEPRLAAFADIFGAISPIRSSIPLQSHHGTMVDLIILCNRLSSAYTLTCIHSHRVASGSTPTAKLDPRHRDARAFTAG